MNFSFSSDRICSVLTKLFESGWGIAKPISHCGFSALLAREPHTDFKVQPSLPICRIFKLQSKEVLNFDFFEEPWLRSMKLSVNDGWISFEPFWKPNKKPPNPNSSQVSVKFDFEVSNETFSELVMEFQSLGSALVSHVCEFSLSSGGRRKNVYFNLAREDAVSSLLRLFHLRPRAIEACEIEAATAQRQIWLDICNKGFIPLSGKNVWPFYNQSGCAINPNWNAFPVQNTSLSELADTFIEGWMNHFSHLKLCATNLVWLGVDEGWEGDYFDSIELKWAFTKSTRFNLVLNFCPNANIKASLLRREVLKSIE